MAAGADGDGPGHPARGRPSGPAGGSGERFTGPFDLPAGGPAGDGPARREL